MSGARFFLISLLISLWFCQEVRSQGCSATLEPHFSVYHSVARDGKNIYTATSMQGYANIAPKVGCPMNTATHKAGAYNLIGTTGGWNYSPSSCPTCYFSITNDQSFVGVPGLDYPWDWQGAEICSMVGAFWDGGGGGSLPGCMVPLTGTTTAVGTNNSNPAGTLFSQVIGDTAGDSFDGLEVQEGNAAPGTDTCNFSTSIYAPLDGVTGGSWAVAGGQVAGQHNTWGWDGVGYFAAAVSYYRTQAPAHGKHIPCGATAYQSMQILCDAGVWWVYTPTSGNTLTATINQTTVTNCRDDMSGTDCQIINY